MCIYLSLIYHHRIHQNYPFEVATAEGHFGRRRKRRRRIFSAKNFMSITRMSNVIDSNNYNVLLTT